MDTNVMNANPLEAALELLETLGGRVVDRCDPVCEVCAPALDIAA